MTAEASIGFLLHPREPETGPLAEAIAVARSHGIETWIARREAERTVPPLLEHTRLLVTVGGDGTFLLGARLVDGSQVPVLGVNRGQLGFLTGAEIDELPAAVEDFAGGRYRLQRRSLLAVRVPGPGQGSPPDLDALALNEIVVRSVGTHLARLRVQVDAELIGEFDADGVIVATATGSTAYALSAGGPPIDPRVRACVLVPLAPHAVLHRPLILPEAVRLTITMVRGESVCAADGHVQVPLREGTCVEVVPGPELFVVELPGTPTFLQRLRDKLRIGLPLKRPEGD